ncbi:hypothetical protein [Candidatus Wolbachia massiliensis]|uniref:Uncharacterized protein n=1 Tax=Candidatus Wolbachia massiliensis TaxID=1845000 RepID=A0A7L7YSP9_9RICK|nr:hypothetical protein [Candidatus Wolbachia massiliensis]QOD38371.1 hypothetical protein ID128_00345 [Candidatus Wolbachia massiliensis]
MTGVTKDSLNTKFFSQVTRGREQLEQELLTLKKRELRRQYVSLATMVPFALLMATELTKVYSDNVLLSVISVGLGHALPLFALMSLVCTLYLIYNNRKIAEKKLELENIKNGEVVEKRERDIPYTVDDYFNYADAVLIASVIVASIVSEALEQGIIEDVAFSISSAFYFVASAISCYREYKKSKECESSKEQENSDPNEKSEKKTDNLPAASLMFAGSSVLLIRRIMLIALASFLHPAIGPALGLVGITLLMVGIGLTACSYNKELEDIKVKGKGTSPGNIVGGNVNAMGVV